MGQGPYTLPIVERTRLQMMIGAVLAISVALLVFLSPTAGAQDDGQSINGTLQYKDDSGERIPVEGVEIVLRDAGGGDLGSVVSGADGTFSLELPGAGDYAASIDVESIPAGVSLRNPDKTELTFNVVDGQSKALAFPMAAGEAGTQEAVSQSAIDSLLRLGMVGIIFGLIIAMCSIGLSLIFGTTGLVNFAHGELVTLGALLTYAFNVGLSWPFLLAAPLAIVLTAGLGGLNDRLLWRPLRARSTGLIAMLVISIGLSILVRYFFLWQFGGRRNPFRQYSLQEPLVELGPISLVPRQVVTIFLSIAVLVAVALVLQRTRFGKAMRAVADNRDLASSSGIDVEQVISYVWISGGALAGLGGILYGLDRGINWDMGFDLLLLIFAAVTLGGLGTAYGALVGSLIIGIMVQVSTYWIPAELKSVSALLVLALILLIRPQGILGQKERIG